MNPLQDTPRRTIHHPDRPVRAEYLEPLLFLADRMATRDARQPPPERSMVDRLAEMAGAGNLRDSDGYRRLSVATACDRLATERARMGALVILALVMKSDTQGGESARAYFSEIRERLGMDAIAVPAAIEEHLGLALEYLRD